jgi:transposase
VVNKKDEKILATHFSKGKMHDFELYKRSQLKFTQKTQIQADLGYKGIEKLHPQVSIPKKKSKYHPLTEKEKANNKKISKSRILVEHVIRKIKIFRIVSERYRNRRKRFSLRMNLIAAIYNLELC